MQPIFKSSLLEAVEVFRDDVMNFSEAYETVIYILAYTVLKWSVMCLYNMEVMNPEKNRSIVFAYYSGQKNK